jgi:outer membrane protein assembly factor BamD
MRKGSWVFLFFVLCLTSCSPKKSVIASKEDLYLKAKKHLLRGEFSLAAENFEKIEENYPFTAEANMAIIMASYSHYKRGSFDESLQLVEYFKKINFDNSNLEYMYFMEIVNNIAKTEDGSKDVTLIKNVINLMDDFNKNFPNNRIYGEYLRQQRERLMDIYVKMELEVVDFYIFSNNLLGALNHLIDIEGKFYGGKHIEEVNYRFFELYRHINYEQGIKKYFKLLENNKDSRWYKYAVGR